MAAGRDGVGHTCWHDEHLALQGQVTEVNAGEVFIVPAGVPHAVAPGSHGTLVIIDR